MWKKILKFEIRSFSDARRTGKEYALEDYYESMLLSEEEYQNLSNREKKLLHQNLSFLLKDYGKDSWANERKKFHNAMRSRAERGASSTMLPTDAYKPRPSQKRQKKQQKTKPISPDFRRISREQFHQRKKEREKRGERRKTTSQMILDYFKMWKNMYNRVPTLTEIVNSEGRPLTIDEETTYNEQYARETQE